MIANFLYRNPRILLLTIIAITAAGVSSFYVLPRLEDPVLGRRVAVVSTAFPGANSHRVESLVTAPLEEKLRGISGIKQVRSNSQTGISNIVIELDDEQYDVEPVWTMVRDRLSDARASLPQTCLASELQVVPLKAFAAIVSVQWSSTNAPKMNVLRKLSRKLRSDIIGIPGTELVDVFGDPGEEYIVEIPATKLASLGLSPGAIAQQIQGTKADLPAGQIAGDSAALPLDLEYAATPLQQLSEAMITHGPRGEFSRLSDVAEISRQLVTPPSGVALIDGNPAIVLGVMANDDLRIDHWANQFQQTIDRFRSRIPGDVVIDILFSQRDHVDQRMQTLLQNLQLGTAAVMVIVLIMMGWRSMIVVAAALPLSAFAVLTAMRIMGIPLHQMSVTGLIVALGLLIDNAIVIVEDVRARIVDGAEPSVAIRGGVRQLAMPLLGSTLTTVLAFLPIATLPGPPGEFVGTIAVSVILAICASFVISMTIIPALISLLRIDPARRGLISYGLTIAPLRKLYDLSLRIVYRVPILGVLLGIVLPAMGFLAAQNLPEQFFPPSDRAQIQIEVEQPARDSLETTRLTVEAIRAIVAADKQIDRQYWFIGGSAPTFFYNVVPRRRGTPFYAQAFIDLKSTDNIGKVVRRLQSTIDNKILQGRVIVRRLEQGPPFDAPVEVRILGPELAVLQRLGSELRGILAQSSHVIHTRSDVEETIPRLSLTVNKIAAKEAGLDDSLVAAQLYTMLEGAPAGNVYEDDEELPVRVKLKLDGDYKFNRLAAMPLPRMNGHRQPGPPGTQLPSSMTTPLSSTTLASLTEKRLTSDAGAIIRVDGHRTNEVKAYIEADVLPSLVMVDFRQRIADSEFVLPDGYELQFGGETEQRKHAVDKLIANGVVLFALMLLTLVASFGSFRCALVVASVGGLSVGLGPLSLSTFGFPFGFMAIVGTMGLVGVAINDSIVVLAAIRADSKASDGDKTEMVNVVIDCSRHIITTTLTTMAGFVPLILNGGGFWPPLAITIAGGVGGATVLALYFVPSCYLLMGNRSRLVKTESQPPAGEV